MARTIVSPSVKEGQQQQADVVEKVVRDQPDQTVADTPSEQITEQTIDPTDPLVASLIEDGELDYNEPALQPLENLTEEQNKQREEERIPPLSVRMDAASKKGTEKWEPIQAQAQRAQSVGDIFNYESEGPTVSSAYTKLSDEKAEAFTEGDQQNTSYSTAFGNFDAGEIATKFEGAKSGTFQMNPDFVFTATAVTENFFAQGGQLDKNDPDFVNEIDTINDLDAASEDLNVSRAQGNERLGQQIWEEWQRERATLDGLESDEYLLTKQSPPREQLEYVGGAMKEAYVQANPDMVSRPSVAANEQVYFQPTEKFLKDIYPKLKVAADAPFDNVNEVPPLNQPPSGSRAQPEFEAKLRTRPEVTKIAEQVDPKALNDMNAARRNLSNMGYMVDSRAKNIVFNMGVPAASQGKLIGDTIGDDDTVWQIGNKVEFKSALAELGVDAQAYQNADNMNIGGDRLFSIMGDKRRLFAALQQAQRELANNQDPKKQEYLQQDVNDALNEFENFNPNKIYRQEVAKFADELHTLGRYDNQVNHFTFSIQMLTGRMHIQQNKLNPQSKKVQRFALRQATGPVGIIPRSNTYAERNFKEVGSTMLGLGGKQLHPEERIRVFDNAHRTGQLNGQIEMGKQLNEIFANANTEGSKAQLGQAIENQDATALQGVPPLEIPSTVQTELNKHDAEERPYVMEYLMDLAKYDESSKKPNPTPFYTTFEAEMDGITHGVTSNGAALGNENTMIRGGVVHTDDVKKQVAPDSDTIGDLRVQMKDSILANAQSVVDQYAKEGFRDEFLELAAIAVKDRPNYLKKAPMTFVYGQELKNLRQHVKATMYTGEFATEIDSLLKQGLDSKQAEDFLLELLQGSLIDTLSAEAVQVSRQLRANNVLATLTGIPLHYDNAMGFRNWIGAKAQTDQFTSPLRFKDADLGKADVRHYRSAIHGAAPRKRGDKTQAGGWGHGRIIPSVVQSYDGNMIQKTSSGESYRKGRHRSRSREHEYGFLPIFDAFKTNYANLDIVRDEANNNWWKGIEDKNFVEDIMGAEGWTKDVYAFLREIQQTNQPINVFEGQFAGVGALLSDDKALTQLIEGTYPLLTKEQLVNTKAMKEFAQEKVKRIHTLLKSKGIDTAALQAETNPNLTPQQVAEVIRTIVGKDGIRLLDTNARLSKDIAAKRKKAFAKVKQQDRAITQVDIG